MVSGLREIVPHVTSRLTGFSIPLVPSVFGVFVMWFGHIPLNEGRSLSLTIVTCCPCLNVHGPTLTENSSIRYIGCCPLGYVRVFSDASAIPYR